MRIRFCMACKTEPSLPGGYCPNCSKKRCSKCGKISVYNTRWDETGKPYCPSCFKRLVMIASQIEGRLDLPTIEAKLDKMERDIANIMRVLGIKSKDLQIAEDSSPSDEHKTKSRRRDFPSLASGADLDSRIDTLLENTDIPAPSLSEIKNRALEIMLESDRQYGDMPETVESETDKPEE